MVDFFDQRVLTFESLFGKPRETKALGEASAMLGVAIGAERVREIRQSQAGVD